MGFPQCPVVDHSCDLAAHLVEVSGDGRQAVENYAVNGGVIVGDYVIVGPDLEPFGVVHQGDQARVQLAGQDKERIAFPYR